MLVGIILLLTFIATMQVMILFKLDTLLNCFIDVNMDVLMRVEEDERK